jgi:hypothetical protein
VREQARETEIRGRRRVVVSMHMWFIIADDRESRTIFSCAGARAGASRGMRWESGLTNSASPFWVGPIVNLRAGRVRQERTSLRANRDVLDVNDRQRLLAKRGQQRRGLAPGSAGIERPHPMAPPAK